MKKFDLQLKYEGLTLIEMIITLLIVGVVLVVTSATLVALIKASAISSARSLSRDESEFILELLEKEIENSRSDDIHLWAVDHSTFNALGDDGQVRPKGIGTVQPRYLNQPADLANEIHYRPVGSEEWICLGYYRGVDEHGEPKGYILKKTLRDETSPYAPSTVDDSDCFQRQNGRGHIILNSDEISVEEFIIRSYATSNDNYTFLIDIVVKPVYWLPGEQSSIKPEYARQLIVSTEKLTF